MVVRYQAMMSEMPARRFRPALLSCHPGEARVSTSYTVLLRNRDQFLRIVGVHHSGRTPTAVDARHDYHVGLDAMPS